MELKDTDVRVQPSLTLPYDEIVVMPLGDLQYGASGSDLDGFAKWIEYGQHLGAYYIGMGDYLDLLSPSNRVSWTSAKLYDSPRDAMQDQVEQLLDDVQQVLKPTKGRWLGLLAGHHYFEFQDGTTTDTRLAQYLDTPYLGDGAALLRLNFRRGQDKSGTYCTIFCAHGLGSGATVASPMNKLERLASRFEADIFLCGHYHRKVGYPFPCLTMTKGANPQLLEKTKILACTGGWLKGYEGGSAKGGVPKSSYVEQALMPPTSLGGVILRIRPVHKRKTEVLELSIEL